MERFIEFEEEIQIEELRAALMEHNPGIMILRHSKLTGTFKVRVETRLSNKEIKRAFLPHKIRKIYEDFPIKAIRTA